MSKKRLNKKGQQAKKNINNAQRIDGEKTIYEVDGKVQVFSENECAEEAHIDGGVVTEETLVVDATNGDVIDAEYEEVDDDYLDDEDEDDDIDVEEFSDIVEEDRFADEATEDDIFRRPNVKHQTDYTPDFSINDVENLPYDRKLIYLLHHKAEMDSRDLFDSRMQELGTMSKNNGRRFLPMDTVILNADYINWTNHDCSSIVSVFDSLSEQYKHFMDSVSTIKNDPNVDDIYYCADLKTMVSGCLLKMQYGCMPINGHVATIRVTIPNDKYYEFIKEYTTRVVMCTTNDRMPPKLLKMAAEGIGAVNELFPCLLLNVDKFLELFKDGRRHYSISDEIKTADCEQGYSIAYYKESFVNRNPVESAAKSYNRSMMQLYANG